jgi:FkbM family methyltransferase
LWRDLSPGCPGRFWDLIAGDTALLQLAARLADHVVPASMMLRLRAMQSKRRGDNPELDLLYKFVQGGIFIDIGANIGDYSRVAALLFPRVYAFEPIPYLASKLRRELPDSVVVTQVALSNAAGRAMLYVPQVGNADKTGLASLVPTAADATEGLREVETELRTLDSFNLGGVDVIKIDVEGFEGPVLDGALGTIERARPAMIIEIEDRHHRNQTVPIFERLWSRGYRSYTLAEGQLDEVGLQSRHWAGVAQDQAAVNRRPDGTYVNNFIFLHPDRVFPGVLR